MAISYKEIRSERQWKACTGLGKDQFLKLATLFGQQYEEIFDETMESRQGHSTSESRFTTYEDLLFFCMYSIKSGLTYDVLALNFNLSRSNTYAQQSLALRVLEGVLNTQGLMPKRSFESEEEFKKFLAGQNSLLVDATEQRSERPGNQEDQKAGYSGKKKDTP